MRCDVSGCQSLNVGASNNLLYEFFCRSSFARVCEYCISSFCNTYLERQVKILFQIYFFSVTSEMKSAKLVAHIRMDK